MVIDSGKITGSLSVSGSYTQTGNAVISGSLTVSGSINATITGSITSASYASYAETLDGLDSTNFTLTSSFQNYTSSANTRLGALEAATASLYSVTSSFNAFSASVLSYTSSINAKTSSFATTGSNAFIGTQTVTGSILQSGSFTSTGTITAQTLVVQTITSSVDFVTGSTRFGTLLANTHQFTGSVGITGSLSVAGDIQIANNVALNALKTSGTPFSLIKMDSTDSVIVGNNQSAVTLTGANIEFRTTTLAAKIFSTNNIVIQNAGTFTDAGFRLDVSGSTRFNGNSIITGSLTVITGSAIEFQVTNTGVKIGNIITDTHTVTGSLNISGSTTATSFTGSLSGTSSYANNADTLDGLDSTVFATTGSVSAFTASINAFSASILSYTSSASTRLSALEAATASLYTTTSSLNASIASLNSYTASNTLTDATQSVRLSALEAATASLYTATSSFSARVGGLEAQSASLLSYTSSTDAKIASIYSTTSSLNASVTSLNAQTASLLSYTSSNNTTNTTQNTRLSALEAATASLYSATSSFSGRVGALEAATASLNNFSSSHNNATASLYNFSSSVNTTTASLNTAVSTLNTYTSSINAKTSSFATTGSNTFIGTQTITGSIFQSGSFTTTGTITAQTLVVQVITSSQNFITGSTKFGTLTSNTHQFTGSVSASGSLNINNGVLYADGGSVGIGTNNPLNQLTVYDAAEPRIQLTSISNYTSGSWIGRDSSGLYLIERQNGAIRFNISGEIMRITGSSVGIGTTGPSYTLDVSGTTRNFGSNEIQFRWDRTSSKAWGLASDSAGGYIKNITDSSIPIYWLNAGNVGIGNTSPGSLLQLGNYSGNPELTFAASTNSYSKINFYDANNTEGLYLRTDGEQHGGTMTFGARWDDDEAKIVFKMYQVSAGGSYHARVGIGTTSPGNTLYVSSSEADYATIIKNTNTSGYGLQVLTAGSSTNLAFQVRTNNTSTNAFQVLDNGNVGIGTTSPTTKLHVSGGHIITRDSTGQEAFIQGSDTYAYFGNLNAGPAAFGNSESYTTLVADGSNIGIGSTSPSAKLDIVTSWSSVNKAVYIRNSNRQINTNSYDTVVIQQDDVTTLRLVEKNDGSSPDQVMAISIGDGNGRIATSAQPLQFYVNGNSGSMGYTGLGGTLAMNIDTAGSIGIGTSSNSAQFYIYNNNTYSAANINEATSSAMAFRIRTRAGINTNIVMGAFDSTQAGLQVIDTGTGAAGSFIINPYGGSIGIGTTAPIARFHISGDGIAANQLRLNHNGTGTNGFLDFNVISTRATITTNYSSDNIPLELKSYGNNNQIFLATNGNVGISTSSPSYKLDVSGSGAYRDSLYVGASDGNNKSLVVNGVGATTATIYFDSTGKTQGLYQTGTQPNYLVGNIGIGTSSPQEHIHIVGTNDLTRGIRFSEAGNNYRSGINWGSSGGANSGWGLDFYTPSSNTGTVTNLSLRGSGVSYFNAGSVGIGTTSPQYLLDSRGTGNFGDSRFYNSVQLTDGYAGTTQGWMWSGAAAKLYFGTGSVGAANTIMVLASGNVGIGTTSPITTLTVGSTDATAEIAPGGGNTHLTLKTVGGGGAVRFYTISGSTGNLATTESMRVNAGGNVGIGTTSPSSIRADKVLHLYGAYSGLTIESTGVARKWNLTANYYGSTAALEIWDETAGAVHTVFQAGGNVGIGTTAPGRKLVVKGDTNISGSIVMGGITDSGGLGTGVIYMLEGQGIAWYNSAFNAGRASIQGTSAGHIILAPTANVGIGTTSPLNKLHVVDTNAMIRVSYDSGGDARYAELGHGSLIGYAGATNNWLTIGFSGGGTPSAGLPNGGVQISTNGSARMTVSKGGDVGIGTDVPQAKLDVKGNIYANDGSSTAISVYNAGSIRGKMSMTGNEGDLTLYGSSANAVVYLSAYYNSYLNAGNVGIGTTSPASKLHVYGGMTTLRAASSGQYDLIRLEDNAGSALGGIGVNTSGFMYLSNTTGGTQHFVLTTGGNVGIGTTSPTEKLHVDGYILNRSKFGYTSMPDVVKRDLQLYIDFNNKTCWDGNVSSTSIKDLSNNNYTMALYNSATISNKDGNYALYTANNSSYLRAVSYYVANQEHTWEAWINADSFNGWDTWFDSGTERPLIGAYNGSFQFYPDGTPNKVLTAGKWYHVVIAMNSAKSYNMYVNGTLIGTATYSDNIRTGTFDLWIGGDQSVETFNGYMAIARTYSRQLSQAEIIQNYNAEKWRFDNNSTFYHDVATGNVGIGTTSPSTKLQVAGTIQSIDIEVFDSGGDPSVLVGDSGAGGLFGFMKWDSAGDYLYLGHSYSSAFNKNIVINGSNIGIGTTSPAYLLDVSGTIRATGDIIAYSDARVKENVNTITNALTKVTSLRGVSYTRNDSEDKSRKVGVIAQEVLPILPEVVQQDANGNYSVAYGNMVGVLIEAIKEQQQQIDELKYLLQTINK